MRVYSAQQVAMYPSGTRTVEKFGKLIGERPHYLGVMGILYRDLTIENIVNALNNVYTSSTKTKAFTRILNKAIEWEITVKYPKKVWFSHIQPTTNQAATANRQKFRVRFQERYFDKFDVILLENKQQLRIVEDPIPTAAGDFEYVVHSLETIEMADGSVQSAPINIAYIRPGRYARYIYNAFPEISERGYVKWYSEREVHRNYMTTFRHSADWSADYAQRESMYIKAGKTNDGKTRFFEMTPVEQLVIEGYKQTREYYNLYGKSNFDANGKCLDYDEKGQEIPIGDGIIRQIERYANRYSVNKLNTDILDDIIYDMVKRSDQEEGNSFTFVCNERFKRLFGTAIKEDLRFQGGNNGAYYYSMQVGRKVHVGANFVSYEVMGNTITLAPNRILSEEYPDQAFAICLNPKANPNGEPTLASFVYGETEMISGYLDGMGGQDGKSSGKIVTPTTVSSYHVLGSAGIVYFNPYMAVMITENVY